ncbi:MAG TPA: glycoside hydrolase family 38 C-terminal domain-containing protein [Candidatus Hydrogenedens sp.]|nr:glycoside hydrolase family 38 C-terminal domain-containing protein [Candidatus Hydrogenedens sp.]
MKKEKDKKHVHFISNTHWDREWLYSFQETRMQLIEFFQRLLNILEKHSDYKSFVLDSQVVPVEDYLEVFPGERARIEEQVKSGRLLIGPWYTCPECFQVGSESIIRNLLYGHCVAREFGKVMKVGYTPFSYGQISQLPQIYYGFGIHIALFYHGVSHDEVSNEFWWEGVDGTKILGSQMSNQARYNFYHQVYRPVVYEMGPDERTWAWEKGGTPFRLADRNAQYEHFLLLQPEKKFNEKELKERVKKLFEKEYEVTKTSHIAFMMGHDSSVPDELEVCLVRETQQILGNHFVEHANYQEYVEQVLKEANQLELPTLRGERRTPKPMPRVYHLYSDVLSSRTRVKQSNFYAECELQRLAEPMSVLSAHLGMEYPKTILDLAWKELLRCHAHDTISGSGVDIIEQDTMHRLRQVREISRSVLRRALAYCQKNINFSMEANNTVLITVYNPLPQEREETIRTVIDIPESISANEFCLENVDTGEEIPVQIHSQERTNVVVSHLEDAKHTLKVHRFQTSFNTSKVPPLGYTSYRVKSGKPFLSGTLITGDRVLENQHIRVAIRDDGTFDIFHKASEKIYCGLGYLVDDGEAGHAWMHIPPADDQILDSRPFPKKIALVEDGPLSATYKIEYEMVIPAQMVSTNEDINDRLDGVGNNSRRSLRQVSIPVQMFITLRNQARSLEMKLKLVNNARDHRLRIAFPSNLDTNIVRAESAFDVVEREIVPGPDNLWKNTKSATFPQNRFVDMSDTWGGLTIINDGLKEYEVSRDSTKTIYVTLLRSYEVHLATVSKQWETHPEMVLSQSPGEHEFNLWIYSHSGGTVQGCVIQETERVHTPLIPVQSGPSKGNQPVSKSFIKIQPDIITMSALKLAEDKQGYILRVYNPSLESIETTIEFDEKLKEIFEVNLEEVVIQKLEISPKITIKIQSNPKKITTIKIVM